jgi:hypothetical protein
MPFQVQISKTIFKKIIHREVLNMPKMRWEEMLTFCC